MTPRASAFCRRHRRVWFCQVYNYSIGGLWQGRVAAGSQLEVIGDKKPV